MRSVLALVLLPLVACAIDGSVGRADTTGGDGSGGGDDGTSAATSTDSSGSGSGGAMSAGGSGDSAGTAGSGTAGGSGGVQDDCQVDQTDHACSECRKHLCCMQLHACLSYDPCPCMWDCVLMGNMSEAECATHCDYEGHTLADLIECTTAHCDPECSDPHHPGPVD